MPVPSEMDAVEISAPGGPEALVPCRRPVPEPGPAEVLIRVEAAGVNRPDLMQRSGDYPPPPGASDIPGLEVAGRVEATGADAAEFAVGDKVTALVSGGGYAAWCVAPEAQALPVPEGMEMHEAAGIPETFFTVWANAFDAGRLREGESFLVHGGASGIGTTAIQLASATGARVFATAGSDERCRACERLGAERGINYRDEDFVAVVKEFTGGEGCDLILDMVGASYLARNIEALAVGGRLSIIAFLGGHKGEIGLAPVLRKRLTVTGSLLRPRSVPEKGRLRDALRERVWPLLEAGRVRPVIARTFPLAEAAAAHALMESEPPLGKIILTTD